MPASALIVGLGVLPVVWEILLSRQKKEGFAPARDAGLANYRDLLNDSDLSAALWRTLEFIVLYVPLTVAVGLALALALNRPIRGIGLYRTCIFAPYIVSASATGVVFRYLLDPQYGLIDNLLAWAGFARQGFLEDPDQALLLLVPIAMWGAVGFDVLLFLAALQGVPNDLVDAAKIDGAGRFAVFRHVMVPALRPIALLVVIWELVNALQSFDLIYATTRGGPVESTSLVLYYAWNQAYGLGHQGYAAAIGSVLFFAIALLALLQLALNRRRTFA